MQQIRANKNLIVAFFCGVCLVVGAVGLAQRNVDPPPVTAANAQELSSVFRQITKDVLPSVVSIETVGKAVTIRGTNQIPFDDESLPFGDLFKNDPRFRQFFDNGTPRQMPRRRGRGSGFIIDSAGIVMTNNHVVAEAETVKIKLQDGREFIATDIKTDPRTDVAIVRFDAPDDLPALRMGDSSQSEIGDWVLAVGSPFGLDGTVTAGIISAKGRGPGIIGRDGREDFLQTDAAINPGNSGGPLLNLNGEVVGINTAISTRSGGYDGIGFAIPINMARWVSSQLIDNGEVKRAYLGVTIQPVDNNLAKQFKVRVGQGAIVTSILPDSPAAKADIQAGDVILQLDGKQVFSPRNLQGIVEKLTIGKKYKMQLLRNGKRKTIEVSVYEMPAASPVASLEDNGRDEGNEKPNEESFSELGVELQALTPELAAQLGAKGESGVVVTSVKQDSPAYEAGLRTGAVIKKVGSHNIASMDDFRKAVKDESLQDGILLLVRHRTGGTGFIVLKSN